MFKLLFSEEAAEIVRDLEGNPQYVAKLKKIRKALGHLELNPRHPGLNSHEYDSLHGPSGESVFELYVENKTPSAWRIWWWYGPERGQITILSIGPHPG